MKPASFSRNKLTPVNFLPVFLLTSFLLSLTAFSQTAQPQLSLADILIGLRSKKVTLPERNSLLTDAVKKRGVTFTLTPEIEKELENTGADKAFVEAIRQTTQKIAAPTAAPLKATPAPVPVAVATPTPDFNFYRKRADEYAGKGSWDLAFVDYNKAIELNPKDISAYFNRARAHTSKKDFNRAISDYDKTIELDPKDAQAYFNRGESYEKTGNAPKAIADYRKAFELDAKNEAAKNNLQRLEAEQAKILLEQKQKEEAAKVIETPVAPKSIELGQLNNLAVKLVTPIYPEIAQKMNVVGTVLVQISLDEQGNVVSAKATSGQKILRATCEDAARRSRFKPALFNNQPIKATGFISYNFTK